MTEQRKFQTDISELLNLIINSFYSNKDVFLRELISNASDAIDKQRYLDLTKSIVNKEYKITIDPISLEKRLIIEDNGIGMSNEDLIQNLSTIAKSGTKEFVKSLNEKSDMIGQFGVGFYSAFLVSNSIDIYTRKEGQNIYHWYSDANQYYSIEEVSDENVFLSSHGTKIILNIKDDCLDYLQETNLRKIISRYSSFILHPIELYVEKEIDDPNYVPPPVVEQPSSTEDVEQPSSTEDVEQPSSTEDVEQPSSTEDVEQPSSTEDVEQPSSTEDVEQPSSEEIEPSSTEEIEQPLSTEDVPSLSDNEDVIVEDVSDNSDDEDEIDSDKLEQQLKTEETKTETIPKIKVKEFQKINGNFPIWYAKPNEVEPSEYENLYKTLSRDWEKPLYWRHFQTEGSFEFKGILYIPKKPQMDLFGGEKNKEKRNIKLYVKKVLVLNELDKEMMPDWMNFVVGVIDSADLPLNVSREMLQQTKVLKALKNQLKKQVMNMMNDLLSNQQKYDEFYESYHKNIKLGIHEGDDSLLNFLQIKNSRDNNMIHLDQYIEEYRKDENQKEIYFITGKDAESSIFVKIYKENGYNVLYFDEAIDEFMLQRLTKYKEYNLVNIAKDHTSPWKTNTINEEEKERLDSLCKWIKEKLEDTNLDEVKLSNKLVKETDEPACVMSSRWGWTGNMEKIMMSQPLSEGSNFSFMKGKRILEINTMHPFIKQLLDNYETEESESTQKVQLLYQCSLLSAGYPLMDTNHFVKNVYSVLNV